MPSPAARRPDDPDLLAAVCSGDAGAVAAWYRGEHPEVYRLAVGFLAQREEAEDLAQDAMLHLLDFQNVDSVVVYDERARADRILQMLQELDGANERHSDEPLEATVIKLEHATIAEAQAALRPFVSYRRSAGGAPMQSSNMVFVQTRSAVVVRDSEEVVAEIKKVLAEIDVPRPQVLLSCWVIRSSEGAVKGGLDLPSELTDNLEKLVPAKGFRALGMGLVNTSVEPDEQIAMTVALGDYGTAQLQMIPRAFDRSSDVLHLRHCQCQLSLRDPLANQQTGRWGGPAAQSLTTQLALRSGEYTVIGAVGSSPVFVVLKMTKRSGPQKAN